MAGKINLTDELKKYFGFNKFKGNQEAIIQNLLDGKDTFVLMPTGGGKSLCYQLPSLLMEGTAIVISPLIALMKNQVDAMRNFSEEDGIAHFINSSLNKGAIDQVRSDILAGKTKLLYVAPESLTKEENVDFLRSVKISFYAVDEAHCISEWGHDFRPEYRRIRPIINEIGKAPLIALTATATPKVQHDIQKNLGMVDAQVFKSSFNRPNLYYEVRAKTNNIDKDIIKFIKNNSEKSGIIYCLSRKKVEELAEILQANGINARPYHAGMDSMTRTKNQDDFLMEKVEVIVATIAFGMGIDKPDVRLVIHLDLPDSIEAYFQEAGRAGRDGAQAYAVLLYQRHDRTRLMKRIPDTFPDKDAIREVYEHICYYYQMAMGDGYNVTREFDLDEFCRNFKHFPVQTDSALHLLERAGYIEYTEEQDNASRIHFLLRRDELYRIHELEAEQEQLIQWVLRSYGGVFSDYVFIDERRIATLSGLTTDQVYHGLLALGRSRILHYIPRKKTPYITFSCKRIEKERIVFPSSVYDERKKNFKERIEAMLYYAEEADFCRSKVLLHYFGEKDAQPCEQCDVCRIRKSHPHADATDEQITALILETLKDGQKHNLSEMTFPGISREKTAQLLHQMIEEETIRIQNGVLFLPRP